jgi:hypothetical protein
MTADYKIILALHYLKITRMSILANNFLASNMRWMLQKSPMLSVQILGGSKSQKLSNWLRTPTWMMVSMGRSAFQFNLDPWDRSRCSVKFLSALSCQLLIEGREKKHLLQTPFTSHRHTILSFRLCKTVQCWVLQKACWSDWTRRLKKKKKKKAFYRDGVLQDQ